MTPPDPLSAAVARALTDRLMVQLASICWAREDADVTPEQFEAMRAVLLSALAPVLEKAEQWRIKHDVACGTIRAMQTEREQRRSYQVLASLSSWLGSGIGDGSVSAENYEQRIREGVDRVLQVEISRRESAESDRAALRARVEALEQERDTTCLSCGIGFGKHSLDCKVRKALKHARPAGEVSR